MLGNQCLVFAFIAIIANYSHALPCKKTWYLIKKAWGVVSIKISLLSLLILSVIAWARYFKQNYSFRASLYWSITPHLNMKHFADIVREGQFLLCRKKVVKSNEMGILYLILEQGKKILTIACVTNKKRVSLSCYAFDIISYNLIYIDYSEYNIKFCS